jgi:SAM-dependent methyltransferase
MVQDNKLIPEFESNRYFKLAYDSKERFISYWHQINEITSLAPKSILEIGIGNGLVSDYLRKRGFNVTTMDIDEALKPDKIGSALSIPFPRNSFELVGCFEVLEHLPYQDFPKALCEIYRVSGKCAVLSLPDCGRVYRVDIQIPKVGHFKKLIRKPRLKSPKHQFDGEHYWEIGKSGYPLRRILDDIHKAGFRVLKTYRVFEIPYHRFFVQVKAEGHDNDSKRLGGVML